MSHIFYDNLLDLSEVEKYVKKHVKSEAERDEIYHLVDEIVHHRVVGCILDKLPTEHHKEFLEKFSEAPHDTALMEYLVSKVGSDISEFIRKEVYLLGTELLELIRPQLEETENGMLLCKHSIYLIGIQERRSFVIGTSIERC